MNSSARPNRSDLLAALRIGVLGVFTVAAALPLGTRAVAQNSPDGESGGDHGGPPKTRTHEPDKTSTEVKKATATPTQAVKETKTPTPAPKETKTPTPKPKDTNTPTQVVKETKTFTPIPKATDTFTPIPKETKTFTPAPKETKTFTPIPKETKTPTRTPTPLEEICRTKGFWGTHAGTEKFNSENITQAVIDAAGGSLSICGRTLTNTSLGNAQSAEEALCVAPQGNQLLQLASQLTAAALNCVLTSGSASCQGVSVFQTFTACNSACAAGRRTATVNGQTIDCISAIDAFNSNPECEQQRLISPVTGLNFEPPGPAGSSGGCNAAIQNSCTIFSC